MKSLGKNAFYNVLYKGLNVLFPLVTMAYVSRVLLPIGVGKVASAQNIVAYFVLIASLGLPVYGVKAIAGCRDDKKEASKVFSELFIINAISSVICSFIYIMMILSLDFFSSKIIISLVVGIQLFANIINIDWLYQGYEEYRYITLRSFFVKTISLIAVLAFVRNEADYVIYALITSLSLVANFVFNIIKFRKFVTLHFKRLNIQKHLKPVLVLFASTIAIEIYVLGGTTILSLLKGDEAVAYYTYSTKAIAVVRTFIVAIGAVFLPRLNYYYSLHQYDKFNSLASLGIRIILNLCIPVAIALFVLADNLVLILFGNQYLPVIPSMRILCVSLVTIALSNFTGYQILISLGKERVVLYSTIIGAVINVIINILLVIPYGHMGASIAAVITEGVIAIYQYYYVLRYVPIKISNSELKNIFIPALVMSIPMIAILCLINNLYIGTIAASILGGLLYCTTSLRLKSDFFFLVLNKIPISQSLRNKIMRL